MAFLSKRQNKTPLGLYVHVPFCRSKCEYCDFYSLACKDDKLMDGYLDAVCAHIKEAGALAPAYKVDTIYFGGGTPSFFGADGISTILATIRRNFDVDSNAEITVECNPDSVDWRSIARRGVQPGFRHRPAAPPDLRRGREPDQSGHPDR